MENSDIQSLVRASIEVKILEAFKSTPQLIDDLVKACLSREVTASGGTPDGWSREKMPYLTYLARDAVQQAARRAVEEYVKSMEPVIKRQVQSKLSAGDMVDALTASIIEVTRHPYKVNVEFKQDKD